MGFLFPKLPTLRIEGPRLDDLSITSSAYGSTLGIGYGTIRTSGNIIWAESIREEKIVTKSKQGGKGGGGQKVIQTDYLYFVNMATAYVEGVAGSLLRQWGDGKTFSDTRLSDSSIGEMDDYNFRFYEGTEDQEPDELIVKVKGEGEVPAYRGIVYIVWEDFPLADFGNRVPNPTVELNMESDPINVASLEFGEDAGEIEADTFDVFWDWSRARLYLPNEAPHATIRHSLLCYDIATLSWIETQDLTSVKYTGGLRFMGMDPNTGHLVGGHQTGGVEPAYVWDPVAQVLVTDVNHNPSVHTAFNHDTQGPMTVINLVTDAVSVAATIVANVEGLEFFTFPGWTFMNSFSGPNPTLLWMGGPLLWWSVSYPIASEEGEAWVLWMNPDSLQVTKYSLSASGLSVNEKNMGTILSTEISTMGEVFNHLSSTPFMYHDPVTGSYIFTIEMGSSAYVVRWSEDVGVIWVSPVAVSDNVLGYTQALTRLDGGNFGYLDHSTTNMYLIDIGTGSVSLLGITSGADWGADVWDGVANCLYEMNSSIGNQALVKHCFGGLGIGSPTTLARIIEDVSRRANLDPVIDIDAEAQVSVSIPGYLITSIAEASSALESLINLYSVSVSEFNGLINFLTRGGAISDTIPEDDMVISKKRKGSYLPYQETIEEDIDLPEKFKVNFQNSNLDYQADSRVTSRVLIPDPTVFTTNERVLSSGAVLEVDVVKQRSEILLYQAWIEATEYETKIPYTYLEAVVGESFDLSFNNGLVVRTRIKSASIGSDFSIKVKFISENAGQYISDTTSETGTIIRQGITKIQQTKLFIWSGPLLRDVDATQRTTTRTYFAGAPLGLIEGNWSGMKLLRSTDGGSSYNVFGTTLVEIPWGLTKNAITNPASFDRYDTVNIIDVNVVEGSDSLETVTDLNIANQENAAVIFKADGTLEYIQYRDVTPLGGSIFRLSTLVRGRRGTEVMADGGHKAGATIAFLGDQNAISGSLQSLTEIGSGRLFKPVTLGGLESTTASQQFTDFGWDLFPYAPVKITAAINGSDVDFDWLRRTRVDGYMRDAVDIPLNEDTESYEVDIFPDGNPASSSLRTLSSSTTTVKYMSADITTDFGSIPTTIWIQVYQLSAQVGRGFALRKEITVN